MTATNFTKLLRTSLAGLVLLITACLLLSATQSCAQIAAVKAEPQQKLEELGLEIQKKQKEWERSKKEIDERLEAMRAEGDIDERLEAMRAEGDIDERLEAMRAEGDSVQNAQQFVQLPSLYERWGFRSTLAEIITRTRAEVVDEDAEQLAEDVRTSIIILRAFFIPRCSLIHHEIDNQTTWLTGWIACLQAIDRAFGGNLTETASDLIDQLEVYIELLILELENDYDGCIYDLDEYIMENGGYSLDMESQVEDFQTYIHNEIVLLRMHALLAFQAVRVSVVA